jgi:hypothetical protein
MPRWRVAVLLLAGCTLSAAAGFWIGFREAWSLGAAVDLLPRGARSVAHLEYLQAGKMRPVVLGLEFDVDNGLVWGYDLVNHPLRELWGPVWGFDGYPSYERYLTRLANYRKDHPSSMRSDMFDAPPAVRTDLQDAYREFSRGAREVAAVRDRMVQRYATQTRP